ncbi:MAG: HEPN domain-containing protein [Candidatus Bathyarchaeia archaeon]
MKGYFMLDDEEYHRWMRSSRMTLESARGDLERGDYNWACFKAHQAAEFAVKALLHGLGLPAHGHGVSKLLMELPEGLEAHGMLREAKALDKYYVPTRYPDAWAEGTPEDYYTGEDAEEAVGYAKKIIDKVEHSWRSLGGEGS